VRGIHASSDTTWDAFEEATTSAEQEISRL
jgi:hypothetical protein